MDTTKGKEIISCFYSEIMLYHLIHKYDAWATQKVLSRKQKCIFFSFEVVTLYPCIVWTFESQLLISFILLPVCCKSSECLPEAPPEHGGILTMLSRKLIWLFWTFWKTYHSDQQYFSIDFEFELPMIYCFVKPEGRTSFHCFWQEDKDRGLKDRSPPSHFDPCRQTWWWWWWLGCWVWWWW